MGAVYKTSIVVPCYNEARRLQLDEFARLLDMARLDLVFVDDGSSDDTAQLLDKFCQAHPGRAVLLRQPVNQGKAEAVRAGMLRALADGAEQIGYFDADLSTPVDELPRLMQALEDTSFQVALAARIATLGRAVKRKPLRHYLGRVFATSVSLILNLRIYDSQCGAKLFRNNVALQQALQQPFISRWAFDVELIGRLLTATDKPLQAGDFVELPLNAWQDVAGSKLHFSDMARAGFDLLSIARIYGRKRR